MMVTLLLYCYATGTRSCRKIVRRCQTDVACRIVVGEDCRESAGVTARRLQVTVRRSGQDRLARISHATWRHGMRRMWQVCS